MKWLICATLLALAPGCTTISNIGQLNRLLPQVQTMVYVRHGAIKDPSLNIIHVCGPVSDQAFLLALGENMGFVVERTDPDDDCLVMRYLIP